ncbi:hypothetical protein [Estrella lausannensis]|uniref:Uncharacterized protein n=1 Tax=Estrella lausannensis TaxID=483423 RepID=A0A0H5DRW5_9BACT|nr:hypothetical protein [Estrella lausannensis]CRX38469.1 conserved hypothetical protein [Estrella lausannensis]
MNKYLLDDYALTGGQVVRSLLISEYGLRHLERANLEPKYAFGHRFIAAIELIPVVGLIVSLVEAIFQAIYRAWQPSDPCIFTGSQSRCNGKYQLLKAKRYVRRLNAKSAPGIYFNPSKLNGSVEGGTCSAMALKLIKIYLRAKTKAASANEGVARERLLSKLSKKSHLFERSSVEYRAIQAALNTIEIKEVPPDPSGSKVESLVKWRGLEVAWSSNCYRLKKQPSSRKGCPYGHLAHDLSGFDEGVYWVRILKPAVNEKLESRGHSLVYIKERGLHLFYDPNDGLSCLQPEKAGLIVERQLRYCAELFRTTDVRFYRLASSL